MRTVICLTALLLIAPVAQAREKTLRVPADDTVTWVTPERFGQRERVVVRVFVNGVEIDDTTYAAGPCPARYGWLTRGVLLEATTACKRAPVRFRVGNLRDRAVSVTVRYRRLATDELS